MDEKGLKNSWLAKQLDCTSQTVRNYRKGKVTPAKAVKRLIAESMGVNENEI